MPSTSIDSPRSLIPNSPLLRTSLWFVLIASGCLVLADLSVTSIDPWPEMRRLLIGMVTPNFGDIVELRDALVLTVAFAILGTVVANAAGFILALLFHYRVTRIVCASVRSVHEIFWALIFLQLFGLTALTGVLAIAIPFTGICAKVYAEILEESDTSALSALPAGSNMVSTFFYARLPDAWVHFKTYSLYRLECAMRSSAVLGFVGLPTLGFYLETAFKEGHYSELSALLIVFFIVIGSVRIWVRRALIPIYVLIALWVMPESNGMSWENAWRFFVHDIVPLPFRSGDLMSVSTWLTFADWGWTLLIKEVLPGIYNTLILTMISLVASGVLALLFFPLISPVFIGRFGRTIGHVFLVVVRSTPEFVLAFVLLQLWGPSMLPAVVALALHNGGVIGHLIGRYTEHLRLRPDRAKGVNLYTYEVLPSVYPQFLAFLFYRWEVILRETAILGILGVHTLGFYVDSAFADIRFDRAIVLIVITAMLNITIDSLSRSIRTRLRLRVAPDAR